MLRRAFALLSLVVVLGIGVAAVPAHAVLRDEDPPAAVPNPPSQFSVQSAGSSKQTLRSAETELDTYIVRLAGAPVARYNGGIGGLKGTSAAATGAARLDADSPATTAYVRYLDAAQRQVLSALERTVGPRVTPTYSYRYALNGFAAALTAEQIAALTALPGVASVERDELHQLDTGAGPAFIGAAQPDQKPAVFRSALTPGQETTPPTGTTPATGGSAVVGYNAATKAITYRVSYQGLSTPATMAHIHIGPPGVAGGVVLNIFDTAVGTPGASGAFIGSKTIVSVAGNVNKTAAEIEAALFAGELYFNIHTATNPGGEIRGQITPARGEGVIIGVLDSGINIANPSFADVGGDGYDHTNPLGKQLGVCDPQSPRYIAGFPCNDKVIGAYTYSVNEEKRDPQEAPSPYDDDGHGTHTASTAGGNVVASTSVNGVGTGPISGVAPHANLVIYDVCGIAVRETNNTVRVVDGCPISALIAAMDQATADGVDVLNRSISSGGVDPWNTDDALAALSVFEAGIVPVGSAGNSGPGASTLVGGVHSAPWTLSVAASTHNRVFVNTLGGFAGGSGGSRPTSPIVGKGVSGSLDLTTIVYAGDPAINNPFCGAFTDAQKPLVAGKIVLCDRGGDIGRVLKANNVKAAGGVGFVLANDQANGSSLVGDAFPIPGVHISYQAGVGLKTWLAGCADCRATISGTTADTNPTYGDVMASFSSRGPSGLSISPGEANSLVGGVLKPDVAAPGVDILAAGVNADPAGPDYQFLSGTSMAAPHVAGAVAIIRQLHPDWTPAEVKSALVTTGVTTLLKENGTTPTDAFDRGGGRVDLQKAIFAGLVFDVSAEAMNAANPEEGGDPGALNLPSLSERACISSCTFVREVRSTLTVPATWNVTTSDDNGLDLSVQPASFVIAPGATQVLTFTADVSGAAFDQYRFGSVTLTPEGGVASAASLPVVVRPTASDLPPTITESARSLRGTITLPVRSILASDLVTETYGLVRTTPQRYSLPEDPTNDLPFDNPTGVLILPVTLPAGTTRYHVRTANSTASDLDLFVYEDSGPNPDGVPQESELVCTSATSSSEELCDFTRDDGTPLPTPVTLLVVVQNYAGSGAATDTFDLFSGIVGSTPAGNLTVGAPESNPGGAAFNLSLTYNLVGAKEGDVYVGLVRLGTTPASAGNLGYSLVTITYDQYNQYLPIIRR